MTQNSTPKIPGPDKYAHTVVYYHENCVDGAAAAYAAHMVYGDQAKYHPIGHDDNDKIMRRILSNPDLANTHIVFTDYAPDRKVAEELLEKAGHISILDHHATAIDSLNGLEHPKLTVITDRKRSGGALTFDALFPGEARPQSIELAQMIDMGRFNQDGSHNEERNYKIAAYMDGIFNNNNESHPKPIADIVRDFKRIDSKSLEDLEELGRAPYEMKRAESAERMRDHVWANVKIAEHMDPINIPMVEARIHHMDRKFNQELKQKAAGHMYKLCMCYYKDSKDTYHVSVRSAGNEQTAQRVAEYLGRKGIKGGGHESEAACHFTKQQFERVFTIRTQAQIDAMLHGPVNVDDANGGPAPGQHDKDHPHGVG